MSRWKDHRPRIIAEPTEAELAVPGRRALIDSLRAAALAWAERRAPAPGEAPSLIVRSDDYPTWETADALAWLFSKGKMGVEPPDTPTVRLAFDYTRTVAGRRLAELALAATGLTAKEVADAAESTPAESGSESGPLTAVFAWLATYFEGWENVDPQLDLLWFHFFGAFGKIARVEAEQRATKAEEEAAQAIAEKKLLERQPTLRRGVAFHRTLLNTKEQVTQSARRATVEGRQTELKAELQREFQYDPLGTYERLTMHALVSIAREMGKLDSHPWATASGRMPLKAPGEDPLRVRIPYPGASEIARVAGHRPGPNGRMPGGVRDAYQRASSSLINRARWIAIDVVYPDWTEDTEIRKDLWVRLVGSKLTRHAYLDIHPAAVASHLRSFEDVPDLGAVYEAARDAMNVHQLRDEFAIADDYLRFLSFSITARQRRLRKAEQNTSEGQLAMITKRVAHTTLLERLGLDEWAKKQGQPASISRVRDALTFCTHVGTLAADFDLEGGVWTLQLRNPASAHMDADQLVALAAVPADDPVSPK